MPNTSARKRRITYKDLGLALGAAALLVMVPNAVEAAGAATGLQIEGALEKLKNLFLGPIAGSIAVIAFFLLGWRLAFGGELDDMSRRAVIILMALCFMVGAGSAYNYFLGSGAVLP
ncbi:MAG: TrbC/VirB2 family protein, partial [Pseudonocardiaceae bacterium]